MSDIESGEFHIFRSDGGLGLATAERHLGHAIKVRKLWHAYDGTHLNEIRDGFRLLGTFGSEEAALRAIESVHRGSANLSLSIPFAGTTNRGKSKVGALVQKEIPDLESRSTSAQKQFSGTPSKLCRTFESSEQNCLSRLFPDDIQQSPFAEPASGRVAEAAHNFTNVFTVIIGFSEMLLKNVKPCDPMYSGLAAIRRAGRDGDAIVRQLLVVGLGRRETQSCVDLNAIIFEHSKELAVLAGTQVRLEVALAPCVGRVKVDALKIQQLLMNLVANSRDAMPAGGDLLLETANAELNNSGARECSFEHTSRPFVRLSVSDTGAGMTRETMSRISEPFFTTKSPGKGTGLGLASVREVVRQCGGTVSIDSEIGKGTTVSMYFPTTEPV